MHTVIGFYGKRLVAKELTEVRGQGRHHHHQQQQ
jgi:hypothetical protein